MPKKLSKTQALVVETSDALLEALQTAGLLTKDLDTVKTVLQESKFQVRGGGSLGFPVYQPPVPVKTKPPRAVSAVDVWKRGGTKDSYACDYFQRVTTRYWWNIAVDMLRSKLMKGEGGWREELIRAAAVENTKNGVIPSYFLHPTGTLAWKALHRGVRDMGQVWDNMSSQDRQSWYRSAMQPLMAARAKRMFSMLMQGGLGKDCKGIVPGILEHIAFYCGNWDEQIEQKRLAKNEHAKQERAETKRRIAQRVTATGWTLHQQSLKGTGLTRDEIKDAWCTLSEAEKDALNERAKAINRRVGE
jgi:hypothetical protein